MTFHVWNTRKLAVRLSRGEIGERDAFAYFLANSVLWTVVSYYDVSVGARYGWLLFYELIVVLAITVFGLAKCFEANGGPDGRHFVLRATCLSFPIGLKLTLLTVVLGWGISFSFPRIFDAATFRDPARAFYLLMFLQAAGLAILFYWRLWIHLSAVRKLTGEAIGDREVPGS